MDETQHAIARLRLAAPCWQRSGSTPQSHNCSRYSRYVLRSPCELPDKYTLRTPTPVLHEGLDVTVRGSDMLNSEGNLTTGATCKIHPPLSLPHAGANARTQYTTLPYASTCKMPTTQRQPQDCTYGSTLCTGKPEMIRTMASDEQSHCGKNIDLSSCTHRYKYIPPLLLVIQSGRRSSLPSTPPRFTRPYIHFSNGSFRTCSPDRQTGRKATHREKKGFFFLCVFVLLGAIRDCKHASSSSNSPPPPVAIMAAFFGCCTPVLLMSPLDESEIEMTGLVVDGWLALTQKKPN